MNLIGREITVLGAGISGLAVAIALARRGAQVRVLEQADAIREVGAGLQISPNGFAVLRALGLADELVATSVRAEAVQLRDYRDGRSVFTMDLTRFDHDQRYYFVHRADLINVLSGAAHAAGVDIKLQQSVTAITQGDDGVRIETAAGQTFDVSLLIGADGVHSIVHDLINGKTAPFFTHQVAWRAIVPTDDKVPPVATVFMGPKRHLVCYPLRDQRFVNIVAVQERREWAEEGWNHPDNPDNLRAAFADFGGVAAGLLERITQTQLWGLFRHPIAPKWHRENTVILGDAAHPTLPFLAQGANLALEDAWVLAECLCGHDETAAALAAYQHRRQDRARKVVGAAGRNAWKYHLSSPPLRFAAHTALRIGGLVAPDLVARQFDWIYRYDVTKP